MQTIYGAERSELYKSSKQFAVRNSVCVSAYVVAPPCIPDIRSGKREVDKVSESFPSGNGISRKTYRVTVRACAGIA